MLNFFYLKKVKKPIHEKGMIHEDKAVTDFEKKKQEYCYI